ncbi:MAG: anaerobic ribonucleoside-triphosphate reductase [Candidatus Helarchaeota archaeon]
MTFDIDELGLPKKVLSALSSSIRVNIIKLLSRKSPLTFTQIMQTMHLEPSSDAGRFGYHLRELKNSGLIKGDENGYNLTDLGEKVVEFIWSLIDFSRSELVKEIPVRTSEYAIEHFDRNKITEALIREAKVPSDLAEEIAKEAEEQLMKAKVKYLTAPLIREVVNGILVLKGYEQFRHNLTRLGLPPFEIAKIIEKPQNRPPHATPYSIQKLLSDAILEQYLLLNVLTHDIADAHLSGDISIANANFYILCPNSIQHDLRPFLQNGLHAFGDSLAVSLQSPKSFRQALILTAKVLEYSQFQCGDIQAIDFFNIFLAPFTKNLSYTEIKDALLLFFNELGTSLIRIGVNQPNVTLNLELEIPKILTEVATTGFKNTTYGDFLDEAQSILEILLDILAEGHFSGKPYFNPQMVFKIRNNAINKSVFDSLLNKLYDVILKWGTPYIANLNPKWQSSNTNYTSLFDRLDSSWTNDIELDTLRTGNLDTVFINLPRIAYESKQNDDQFFEKLEAKIKLAVEALIIKREQIYTRIFDGNLLPFLTYPIDREPYFRMENATNAISYLGLPEAVEIHTNSKISSKNGLKFALDILQRFNNALQTTIDDTGTRWVLKQPFSHAWIDRLLQLDQKRFIPNSERKSSSLCRFYSTSNVNSTYSLSLTEKIRIEANFQKYLNGGHLMTIPLTPSSNSRTSLIEWIKRICNASIGLFSFAFELSYCEKCKKTYRGFLKRCLSCESTQNINYFNSIMGPYRAFKTLSKSEQYEIAHRFQFTI